MAIPLEIYQKIEAEAVERRKNTGESISWSVIVKEILNQHYETF